jgi:ParB family chromosome partitioning protein
VRKTGETLALARYNDIFNVGSGDMITEVPLPELFPPDFHPFQVNDGAEMERLAESVKEYGVREPGLVRPKPDGSYELLVGNRRKRACELAEKVSMPVIIRELRDNQAVKIMGDSNLQQREKLLFSEKAWAYRIKMEALNHKGVKSGNHRTDRREPQHGFQDDSSD